MIIFLDMDGVIADYKAQCITRMGPPKEGIQNYEMHTGYGYKHESDFINKISGIAGFWTQMPKTPEADIIMAECRSNGKVMLLSNPKHCPIWEHKLQWAYQHFGVPREDIILTQHKHFLARVPTSILIDDNLSIVNQWSAHGGRSFYWQYGADPIIQLLRLREFFQKPNTR